MTQFVRTALILFGAASLAACSTYEPFEAAGEPPRPNYPTRLSETPPPAPPRDPALPEAKPTTPVEARALPPAAPSNQPGYVTPSVPPEPAASYPLPAPPRPAPPPAAMPAPPPRPTPPPAPRTVTKLSVTGKVVEVGGPPKTYTVAKGDNLDRIAKKMGLERKELADLNKLKSPYALKPGQELKGPATKAKAYTVGAGDTLFAIARRFSVTAQDLAKANDISTKASVRVGQKLRLPDGYKDKGPLRTTVTETPPLPPPPTYTPPVYPQRPPPPTYTPPVYPPPPPTYTPPVYPQRPPPPTYTPPVYPQRPPAATPSRPTVPAPPVPPGSSAPVIVPSTGVLTDSQISQLGRGRFVWPLRGELISAFGPKGTGQRNDGIDIRTILGAPVQASATGDVVYAGDQVPGFGNLVLVKHADGWVTAYGHMSRVDVKIQQRVTQGQQLGLAGASGGVAEPQLHFEVRYAPTPADRARPIDPNLVLPK